MNLPARHGISPALRWKRLAMPGLIVLAAFAVAACGGTSAGGSTVGRTQENFALPTPTFPTKTIELIVGSEAGSPEDAFARAIGEAYAAALPGEFAVVNRPGEGGVTALEGFADREADGHSMLVFTDSQLTELAAGRTDVDVTRVYLPVLLGVDEPFLIFAAAGDSRFPDWDSAAAAAAAGGLAVASSGGDDGVEALSVNRLAADLSIGLERVAIEDPGARLAAPGDGTADLLLATLSESQAAVTAGDLRPLLALWPERLPGLENVPTATEAGSSFEGLPRLMGIAINRRTPQFLTDRIGATLRQAFNSAGYSSWLKSTGLEGVTVPSGDPGLEFRSQIPIYRDLLAK